MIKSLIKLVLILVIGILVYNYFLGDPTEKENARKIFSEVKEVGIAVKDLLKTEKAKFDEGKYDDALDKVGSMFEKLKKKAEDIDTDYVDRIAQLEDKRKGLERRLNELSDEGTPDDYDNLSPKGKEERQKLQEELRDLMKETEKVMEEMEKDSQ